MGTLTGKTAVVTGSTSGIGLAYRARLGRRRRQHRHQRHGRGSRYRARALRHRDRFQGQGGAFAGRHDQACRDRRHDRARRKDLRLGRRPRQQCRHPVRLADRGIPDREVGRHHRDQPVGGISWHPRRGARHEEAQLGPHHQHGVGAFAGRLALQVGLCVGQARHRRPHQDGGAGGCDPQDHLQLHQSRLCLDAAGREADPRYHEGAQPDQGAGHPRRAARGAADQGIRHLRAGRGAGAVSCGDDAAQITGANLSIDGGWTAE